MVCEKNIIVTWKVWNVTVYDVKTWPQYIGLGLSTNTSPAMFMEPITSQYRRYIVDVAEHCGNLLIPMVMQIINIF